MLYGRLGNNLKGRAQTRFLVWIILLAVQSTAILKSQSPAKLVESIIRTNIPLRKLVLERRVYQGNKELSKPEYYHFVHDDGRILFRKLDKLEHVENLSFPGSILAGSVTNFNWVLVRGVFQEWHAHREPTKSENQVQDLVNLGKLILSDYLFCGILRLEPGSFEVLDKHHFKARLATGSSIRGEIQRWDEQMRPLEIRYSHAPKVSTNWVECSFSGKEDLLPSEIQNSVLINGRKTPIMQFKVIASERAIAVANEVFLPDAFLRVKQAKHHLIFTNEKAFQKIDGKLEPLKPEEENPLKRRPNLHPGVFLTLCGVITVAAGIVFWIQRSKNG